jgi:hypothetical protein
MAFRTIRFEMKARNPTGPIVRGAFDMEPAYTPQKNSRVRASRFRPDRSMVVSSKTLGTGLIYDLITENVSRSGMLLNWEHRLPIPFIESTILEMTIDPGGEWLEKPLKCLGKIVRREVESSTSHYNDISFGVAIVQIDDEDQAKWERCITDLASRATPLLTEDPKLKAQAS